MGKWLSCLIPYTWELVLSFGAAHGEMRKELGQRFHWGKGSGDKNAKRQSDWARCLFQEVLQWVWAKAWKTPRWESETGWSWRMATNAPIQCQAQSLSKQMFYIFWKGVGFQFKFNLDSPWASGRVLSLRESRVFHAFCWWCKEVRDIFPYSRHQRCLTWTWHLYYAHFSWSQTVPCIPYRAGFLPASVTWNEAKDCCLKLLFFFKKKNKISPKIYFLLFAFISGEMAVLSVENCRRVETQRKWCLMSSEITIRVTMIEEMKYFYGFSPILTLRRLTHLTQNQTLHCAPCIPTLFQTTLANSVTCYHTQTMTLGSAQWRLCFALSNLSSLCIKWNRWQRKVSLLKSPLLPSTFADSLDNRIKDTVSCTTRKFLRVFASGGEGVHISIILQFF
jgi:hypothetical protein